MKVAILAKTSFYKNERDDPCMTALVWCAGEKTPTDFYFTGTNSFNDFAYKWCKTYQRSEPASRLIYVAADEDTEEILSYKRSQFDLVIRPTLHTKRMEGLSVQEQYMIDECDKLILYHDGGVDRYRFTFHARLRGKRVIDYFLNANLSLYDPLCRMAVTEQELFDFGIDVNEQCAFVKNLLIYMHLHSELMKTPQYFQIYDDALVFLFEAFGYDRSYIFCDFEQCKRYIIEEIDLLAQEVADLSKIPVTQEVYSAFCEHHEKYKNSVDF